MNIRKSNLPAIKSIIVIGKQFAAPANSPLPKGSVMNRPAYQIQMFKSNPQKIICLRVTCKSQDQSIFRDIELNRNSNLEMLFTTITEVFELGYYGRFAFFDGQRSEINKAAKLNRTFLVDNKIELICQGLTQLIEFKVDYLKSIKPNMNKRYPFLRHWHGLPNGDDFMIQASDSNAKWKMRIKCRMLNHSRKLRANPQV